MGVNDDIASRLIALQAASLRKGVQISNSMSSFIDGAERDINRRIRADTGHQSRSAGAIARKYGERIGEALEEELMDFAERRAQAIATDLQRRVGIKLEVPDRTGSLKIMKGTVSKWMGDSTELAAERAKNAVRQGLDGEASIKLLRAHTKTLARSGTTAAHNAAVLAIAKMNAGFIQGVLALATLDSRTSEICNERHGGAWDNDGNALPWSTVSYSFPGRPPWHFNCRTTLTPIIQGEDLPGDETLDRDQWFASQDASDVFGPDQIEQLQRGETDVLYMLDNQPDQNDVASQRLDALEKVGRQKTKVSLTDFKVDEKFDTDAYSARDERWKTALTQNVDLNELVATRSDIEVRRVKDELAKNKDPKIQVIRKDGKLYVINGHPALMAEKLRGNQQTQVLILDHGGETQVPPPVVVTPTPVVVTPTPVVVTPPLPSSVFAAPQKRSKEEALALLEGQQMIDRRGNPAEYTEDYKQFALVRPPFEVRSDNKVETDKEWKDNTKTFEEQGTLEKIDVASLKTIQSSIEKHRVAKLIASGEITGADNVRDSIRVIEINGELFIWDGNHRASAASFLGQQKVEAYVLRSGTLSRGGVEYRAGAPATDTPPALDLDPIEDKDLLKFQQSSLNEIVPGKDLYRRDRAAFLEPSYGSVPNSKIVPAKRSKDHIDTYSVKGEDKDQVDKVLESLDHFPPEFHKKLKDANIKLTVSKETVKREGVLGSYNARTGDVSVRLHDTAGYDPRQTVVHELGHAVDLTTKGGLTNSDAFQDALGKDNVSDIGSKLYGKAHSLPADKLKKLEQWEKVLTPPDIAKLKYALSNPEETWAELFVTVHASVTPAAQSYTSKALRDAHADLFPKTLKTMKVLYKKWLSE